jgi:hypothetical protein
MIMTTDERAIQEILQQFEAPWNAYDSAGIGALFAADAGFIHLFRGQLSDEPPSTLLRIG